MHMAGVRTHTAQAHEQNFTGAEAQLLEHDLRTDMRTVSIGMPFKSAAKNTNLGMPNQISTGVCNPKLLLCLQQLVASSKQPGHALGDLTPMLVQRA